MIMRAIAILVIATLMFAPASASDRDQDRALQRQADSLERIERVQRERARDEDRVRRNAARDARSLRRFDQR
ncbi:hypothetical protein [Enterovirga aerilata]|uniref:Uncharacterized protein n=1 Tax=Enterovirga aerilata TaxID=2730920 RepID=A0A849I4X2_9HYPH|nr:hypothetical protein [Enterovirga sp. DB1703]NNM72418.1 hypothetical protein [Enterovirga sp. DB1703]